MPTYDYLCPSCHARFELFTKVHDTTTKPCPKCGKKRAKRQIGAGAGFIFKGSGFYVTDSKPGSAKSDVSSDAKTETKPEKKSSESPKKKAE